MLPKFHKKQGYDVEVIASLETFDKDGKPCLYSGKKKYINENDCVYFVHSYYATDCGDSVIATTEYGREMTAAVELGNVKGCQFHPEKSGKVGLAILKAFCED